MIDPIAFTIGPLAVHWYGISYGVGLLLGIFILIKLNKKRPVFKDSGQIYDFAFLVFLLGVILGGRLGYVIFYNLGFYLENPLKILSIWDGGMSFHGGLFVSVAVGYFFCKKNKIHFYDLADLVVIPGALALTFTRVANFINRELVGRPIESPNWEWLGVDFGDGILRYPSQLFQSASAMLLFLVLLFIFSKKPRRGILFYSYLTFYGLFRIITELWRAPDAHIGFLFGFITRGQILSFLVFAAGLVGLYLLKRRTS